MQFLILGSCTDHTGTVLVNLVALMQNTIFKLSDPSRFDLYLMIGQLQAHETCLNHNHEKSHMGFSRVIPQKCSEPEGIHSLSCFWGH